jgi:hypothetical protein
MPDEIMGMAIVTDERMRADQLLIVGSIDDERAQEIATAIYETVMAPVRRKLWLHAAPGPLADAVAQGVMAGCQRLARARAFGLIHNVGEGDDA